MMVRRILLGLCLLFLLFPAKAENEWEVGPFSGSLSGKTVTVTRNLWAEGQLMPGKKEDRLRPEMAFALYCVQAELPGCSLTFEQISAYMAAVSFPDQETGVWLRENAWRFGLITEEKMGNLRFRYVGPVHAAVLHALQMDLEAYLFFLRQTGQAVLKRNGQAVAWIFCVPASEALSFTLPESAAFSVSGDGAGFVVIAIGC